MNVDMRVYDALERVEAEQEHITHTLAAFDQFESGVRDIPAAGPNSTNAGHVTDGGVASLSTTLHEQSVQTDHAQQVRDLFVETVRPYSLEDVDEPESTLETIRTELGDEIALMLSPNTGGRFTPELKTAVLEATVQRRDELRAMDRALGTEAASLQNGRDELEAIIDWLMDVDEVSLLNHGFETLRERHETLATHRDRCDQLARERQKVLHKTTSHNGTAGLTHDSLTAFLYQDFPTSYPVLSTVTRLDSVLVDCQRTVRDHLTRRV